MIDFVDMKGCAKFLQHKEYTWFVLKAAAASTHSDFSFKSEQLFLTALCITAHCFSNIESFHAALNNKYSCASPVWFINDINSHAHQGWAHKGGDLADCHPTLIHYKRQRGKRHLDQLKELLPGPVSTGVIRKL